MKTYNNSLKPTITRVTHFAQIAKLLPHYGGLIPPFCDQELGITIVEWHVYVEGTAHSQII